MRKGSGGWIVRVLSLFLAVFPFSVKSFRAHLTYTTRQKIDSSSRALRAMKGAVYICTSLDGYIATKDGGVGFLDELAKPKPEEGDMGFGAFLASVDVMIMGRNTFEKVLSFGKEMWPYGDTKVVVWSRKGADIPDYRASTVSSSSLPPTELFAELDKEGYQCAYIDGGTTVQKFMEAGLVHKLCLSTAPVLLGSGIPLFAEGKQVKLRHIDTKSYSNGVVSSWYDWL
jgi:dihydrofolate reductase